MQPFLQNLNITNRTSQSNEVPKYLELLADNDSVVLRENPTSGYEVPRSIHISDQNLTNMSKFNNCVNQNRKCSLPSETSANQKEHSTEERKQCNRKFYERRASIASLNLSDRKGASTLCMSEKSNTLDNLKSVHLIAKTILKRDSFSSLNDQRKCDTNLNERRNSEASLEGKSSSSASLAPSTRPSSSLINSQTVLPLKTNSVDTEIGDVPEKEKNETTVTKNTLPKIQRTHSNLQNSKANIPLVINSALLNLLRQTPIVDDSSNIVTYTSINSDLSR